MKQLQKLLDSVGFYKDIRVEAMLLDSQSNKPILPAFGTGKYLLEISDEKDSVMVFSLCIHRNYDPAILEDNDGVFGISFVFVREFYYFTAQLLSICESVSMRIPEHIEDVYHDLTNFDEYKIYLLRVELISAPEVYKRPNRRDHFRISLQLPIYYEVVPQEEEKLLKKHDFNPRKISDTVNNEAANNLNANNETVSMDNFPGFLKLTTENIGGGGFRGITKNELAVNSIIDCVISGTPELLPFYARIINVKRSRKNKEYYEVRGRFENVNELVRDRLVQYLFQITREKRKGLNRIV